ncbi:MAG: ATP-grasp domain-containing protein [Chromatiales bacterium]|nr:ATP-grasp domain-containing protein [Chromatiales bacterium]
MLRKRADVEPAWDALGSVPLILEGFVDVRPRGVDRRRAQHARRGARLPGRRQHAPRRHPARDAWRRRRDARLQRAAEGHLQRVLRPLRLRRRADASSSSSRDGRLVANEMAPRVHNSGHWTIEGAVDLAVREPPARDPRPAARRHAARSATAAMVNFIGTLPDREPILGPARRAPPRLRQGSRGRAASSATARSWRPPRPGATRLLRQAAAARCRADAACRALRHARVM